MAYLLESYIFSDHMILGCSIIAVLELGVRQHKLYKNLKCKLCKGNSLNFIDNQKFIVKWRLKRNLMVGLVRKRKSS